MIYPLLYQMAYSNEKVILESNFGIEGISIATLILERLIIDKLFAAESNLMRRKFYDVSKHLYDIYQLFQQNRIQQFCLNKRSVEFILTIQRSEELNRHGGIEPTQRFLDFDIFEEEKMNKVITSSFDRMQDVYIFQSKDRIRLEEIFECQRRIRKLLASHDSNDQW